MSQIFSAHEMLERLVAFPTVSKSSNRDLIDFVQDYLQSHGVPVTVLPNGKGDKAALLATLGPVGPGGVVLSGHSDVVPVEGQDWSSDPWRLRARDGRLFGRGACDMKGFCAAALAMVPQFQAAGLKRPIHIAISYDEEIGCFGVQPLIDYLTKTLPRPEAVIVGEPSEMTVLNAHKGTWSLVTRVTGYEVHSSICHTGVSAVMAAARLVTWLEDRMLENAKNASAVGPASGFAPPYTTLHVGRIKGGSSGNITAGYCSFPVDIRVMPGEDMDQWLQLYLDHVSQMQAKLRKVRPEASISVAVNARVAGLTAEVDGPAEALVKQLTGDHISRQAGFGSEAGLFQEAGFSTTICGPGSMDQAHQPDEFISLDQLDHCTAFMRSLSERLSA
ncbi:acetylornithine deacetylase [Pseudophaeobacter sp.]|uniref:acetylornithine deacetylase n=1 Tax=Pseudophaeobacter sp. TaxID=1971739 RepID=UPI0040597826